MTRAIKYNLLGLIFCFCNFIAIGQKSKIDSLVSVMAQAKDDSNKVKALNTLAYELRNNVIPDSCIQLSKKALSLSEKINWDKGIGESYSNLQWFYMLKTDFASSLNYGFKTLDFWINLNQKKDNQNNNFIEGEISLAYAAIGSVYADMGDKKAIEYYSKAIEREERSGDKNALSVHYGYMGNFYLDQLKNYNKALDYYSKALVYCEELGQENRASFWLGNTGAILVTLAKEKGISAHRRDSLQDGAMNYFLRALKITEKIVNKRWQAALLNNIGNLFISRGKFKEAKEYLSTSLSISKEIKNLPNIIEAEKSLSDLYDITGKTQLAFDHFKSFIAARDSLNSDENAKSLTFIEIKYEQDKKDLQIVEDKRRQKIITYSVSAGLILVLLLSIFIFRSYQQKQKSNLLLSEKNKIIEEKNKDITDSITYAKRIQQAKLPKKEDIYSSLTQSFILFKPKDIVSGDFYFFHKNSQSIFIAAADCTGHGVPGAFMSMIGSEQLNDAVSKSTDTSEILRQLNKGIKTSLRQSDSDESTRDGMDIALCSIDTQNRIVKYSGANRPLWVIENGQTEVQEIKATKTAIGGLTEDNQHFDTHEIKLQQGDTFYICTDGYADQFSGQDGKKLMTRKFKEILGNIQSKSMQEQETYLDNFIENWKSGTEQVDDILVIGVRL